MRPVFKNRRSSIGVIWYITYPHQHRVSTHFDFNHWVMDLNAHTMWPTFV